MARDGFDYGGETPLSAGGMFKQPEVGQATGRVRSIIHIGRFSKIWKGTAAPAAPYVAVIFELHDQWEDEEETIPLTTSIAFPLKKGDKANMVKFLNAVDPDDKAAGFGDCIGLPASLNMVGSKDKDDDGNPKFVNCKEVTAVPKSILKHLPELQVKGVGHVAFVDMTKEAVLELNPHLHVAAIMEKAENYKGSQAEKVVAEIRKEDPDFAKASTSTREDAGKDDRPEPPPPDMDESEEY